MKRARPWQPLREESALLLAAEELLERARRAGADEAEVCAEGHSTLRVRHAGAGHALTHVDSASAFGLTVLVGGQRGFASGSAADDAARDRLVAEAIELARLPHGETRLGLPDPSPTTARLELVQPSLAALTVEELSTLAEDLRARASRLDRRLCFERIDTQLVRRSTCVTSTRGTRVSASDASLGTHLIALARAGCEASGLEAAGEMARHPDDWEERSGQALAAVAEGALGGLAARPGRSYRGALLLSPRALRSLLVQPLLSALDGEAVRRGRSPLAVRVGERLAPADFTLVDDPRDPELRGACAFDREGWPTAATTLVRGGVPTGYLHHAESARALGQARSGHAQGGTRALPQIGAHAPRLAGGGGGERAELLAQLGTGLCVQRFSGSIDAASGDFSGVAKSAFWVERGQLGGPVRETLVSGNVFALLAGPLALARSPERLGGAALLPWALVDGVTVTCGS